MGYSGAFPSEDSSGNRIRKGGITKAGNAHLRRIVMESAWAIDTCPASGKSCVNDIKAFQRRSSKSHGRRRIACTSATEN